MDQPPPPPSPAPRPQIQLTKHDGVTFTGGTVHTVGHGFFNCRFVGCTLVCSNGPRRFERCTFERCNWRIEYDVLWGDPNSRSALRQLLDLVDGAADMQGPGAAG